MYEATVPNYFCIQITFNNHINSCFFFTKKYIVSIQTRTAPIKNNAFIIKVSIGFLIFTFDILLQI